MFPPTLRTLRDRFLFPGEPSIVVLGDEADPNPDFLGHDLLQTMTENKDIPESGPLLDCNVLSTSAPSIASTATTALPSPELPGPAANFGVVSEGCIYRSSFPKIPNFEHMKTLGLKTILTLVDEPYPLENQQFISDNHIMHVVLPLPAHKNTFDSIPVDDMQRALSILMDPSNFPVLIHCNKGKHRTGCVVGCYRKINDWSMDDALAEYRHYAGAKARALDEKYMDLFNKDATKLTIAKSLAAAAGQPLPLGMGLARASTI